MEKKKAKKPILHRLVHETIYLQLHSLVSRKIEIFIINNGYMSS